MAISMLSPTQRYAAGALLALALRQAQIHQTRPLGCDDDDDDDSDANSRDRFSSSDGDDDVDSSHLWTHESRGLLRPVFRFLDIDPRAWRGLEETAASSKAKRYIGAV